MREVVGRAMRYEVLVKMSFSDAYYWAGRIVAMVKGETDEEDWIDSILDPDSEDFLQRIASPQKYTLLHDFIQNVVAGDLDYSTGKDPEMEVQSYESLLRDNDFVVPSWLNEYEVGDHIQELDKMLEKVSHCVTLPIFHLLFSDRVFLFQFQELVKAVIEDLEMTDHPDILDDDGILKRPNYLPEWLTTAVFHRDQGRCQKCYKDLSALLVPVKDLDYDHIIPLAASGSNDPTNFQLLCQECNRRKGTKEILTPRKVYLYWDME